ncbi:hypothetical protein NHX12_016538 [Muraenolepis orangiensis]|uniref:Uncharacterized protein n=1 Tax=Muraenolepis orangiensis TaxID=630683 RepID=A0A9Q0D7K9_9TELE|nr:hypothetical protein NHX12_016538 [Muraenolepis orangiensis]
MLHSVLQVDQGDTVGQSERWGAELHGAGHKAEGDEGLNRTINRMLLEVKEDQPHLWPSIHQSLVQANLSLPSPSSTPATCQLAGSSARSRSSASSASSSSSRAPALCSPATRTVELGLGLSVTSSGLAVSPRPGSTNGSRSSRRSGRGKNP